MPPLWRGHRTVRAVLALLAVVLATAGCRVDVGVEITVQRAGGGQVAVSVTLDDDAVDRLGGDLGAVLELDDLRAAGWSIEGPEAAEGGGSVVSARKAFAGWDHAVEVLEEVTGAGGPLRELELGRETGLTRTEWWFEATADLSEGIEAFGDDAIATELDGLPIGRPVEDLEAELGEPIAEVVSFVVSARMPEGTVERWELRPGDGPTELVVHTSERRTEVLVWFGVAALLALVFVVWMLLRLVRGGRGRRPAHAA